MPFPSINRTIRTGALFEVVRQTWIRLQAGCPPDEYLLTGSRKQTKNH
jgi:hypothetical protein